MRVTDLTESVRVRIDHPEDLVWKYAGQGAVDAIAALKSIADGNCNLSIKWDGSIALIFGYINGQFILTDKTGFNNKQVNVKSPEALFDMLFNRAPNQAGRKEFAASISSLWNVLKRITPDTGCLYQADLLYSSRPDLVDGAYTFMPNKIKYTVDAESDTGLQIAKSDICIVLHSMIDPTDHSISPATAKCLDYNPAVLVLQANMPNSVQFAGVDDIAVNSAVLDDILDKDVLRSKKISDFGAQIGKFLAWRARQGIVDTTNLSDSFSSWVDFAKLSSQKKDSIHAYLDDNVDSVNAIWNHISDIIKMKTEIKHSIDMQCADTNGIDPTLHDVKSHEGYVATTDAATIKLVDRHKFMRRPTVVIYAGKFQPAHPGHAAAYKWLAEQYDTVLVATSNLAAPFDFAEKKRLLAAVGIPEHVIHQVTNPYKCHEITDDFDLNNVELVHTIASKDMTGDKPRFTYAKKKDGTDPYFLPYTMNRQQAAKHGYILVMPTFTFTVDGTEMQSATEVRNLIASTSKHNHTRILSQLYQR
jgi:hypothetical protein